MALNSTGAISLGGTTAGQSIAIELGGNGTTAITMNDTTVRNLAGVASGAISLNNFYGKASAYTFNATIAANTANYNLRAAAVTAGWNQTLPLKATVTINSGIYVYSTSTGTYAFDTGTTFPTGTTLALVNNGIIIGMGGAGGTGGAPWAGSGTAGAVGGPAFIARQAISVTNNGTIGGGGGGGGGGGASG